LVLVTVSWWGHPYGWGYDPWSPYGFRYSQYVFDNTEEAVESGYKQGFKTGKDDGKKAKSYNPQRSHYFKEAGFGNFADVYRSGFSRGYGEGFARGPMNEPERMPANQDGYCGHQKRRGAKRRGVFVVFFVPLCR
jgi:hypothetical protein